MSRASSKGYSSLILSVIESLLKQVEKFHSNMLWQYSTHTESFSDGDQQMTNQTPHQETRGHTTHGFRNMITSYKECYKWMHIPQVSQEEL
jgi:hypothetical protein